MMYTMCGTIDETGNRKYEEDGTGNKREYKKRKYKAMRKENKTRR